jgi:hypothetical protein
MMMLQLGYHVLLAWSNITLSQWTEDSTEFQTKLSTQSHAGTANQTSNITLVSLTADQTSYLIKFHVGSASQSHAGSTKQDHVG